MVTTVKKIIRGCGERVEGGLYVRVATSPYGMPLEHFLIDAPMPYLGTVNREPFFEGENAYFWVGEQFYPYATDFIEEARLYGVSKRLPLSADLSKYKPFITQLFFIHPRAVANKITTVDKCPKGKESHEAGQERCIRSLYYFLKEQDVKPFGQEYERTIGSTSYVTPRLEDRSGVTFKPGLFMCLPFSHFEYVAPKNGLIDPRVDQAIKSGANIICVNEEEAE